jgi:hypothetical protein
LEVIQYPEGGEYGENQGVTDMKLACGQQERKGMKGGRKERDIGDGQGRRRHTLLALSRLELGKARVDRVARADRDATWQLIRPEISIAKQETKGGSDSKLTRRSSRQIQGW